MQNQFPSTYQFQEGFNQQLPPCSQYGQGVGGGGFDMMGSVAGGFGGGGAGFESVYGGSGC